jgi:hypothetical protein
VYSFGGGGGEIYKKKEVLIFFMFFLAGLPDRVPPGLKLELLGPLECRRGVILLNANSVRILGGAAEEMEETYAADRVLADRIAGGDPTVRDNLLEAHSNTAPATLLPLPIIPAVDDRRLPVQAQDGFRLVAGTTGGGSVARGGVRNGSLSVRPPSLGDRVIGAAANTQRAKTGGLGGDPSGRLAHGGAAVVRAADVSYGGPAGMAANQSRLIRNDGQPAPWADRSQLSVTSAAHQRSETFLCKVNDTVFFIFSLGIVKPFFTLEE